MPISDQSINRTAYWTIRAWRFGPVILLRLISLGTLFKAATMYSSDPARATFFLVGALLAYVWARDRAVTAATLEALTNPPPDAE